MFPKIHPRYKIAFYFLVILKPFSRFFLGSPYIVKNVGTFPNNQPEGLFIYIPDPTRILPFKDLVYQVKFFDISYFKNETFLVLLLISIGIFTFLIYRWTATYFFYRQLSKEEEIDPNKGKKLYEFIEYVCRVLKIKRVRLLESKKISSPFTVGIINPAIILPRTVIANLTEGEIQQVVLHEIMHVKRRDSIKKWFLTIIGDLLFFAPPIYIARKKINDYIEQDCDFKTISFNKNPKDLANGILKIASLIKENKLLQEKPIIISNMFLYKTLSLKNRITSFSNKKPLTTRAWRTASFYILYVVFFICQISILISINGKLIIF
ncbi:MAG: M56 family metallopeptidase [Actinobacteria bacterium]|nr:M56 family metallopeptidase [Actinomycetota bacterium]